MSNIRGNLIAKRTYCRPLDASNQEREQWHQVAQRVRDHSERLWKEAGGTPQAVELDRLREIINNRREGLVAGRTMWLGGTEYAFTRACSQFNCAFSNIDTPEDIRDLFWLLLNGCGVGFNPKNVGIRQVLGINPAIALTVEVTDRSPAYRGRENTVIAVTGDNTHIGNILSINVGDSAEGWVELIYQILLLPYRENYKEIDRVSIVFSECRGGGEAIKGYGWTCNGPKPFSEVIFQVFKLMQLADTTPLNPIFVLDIMNLLGSVLSTRRSAQIAILEHDNPYIDVFMDAKSRENMTKYPWRCQSNNSVLFIDGPSDEEILKVRDAIRTHKIEPGVINGDAARKRAPWFEGVNPCVEILLPDGGFCNLVEVNIDSFYYGGEFHIDEAEEVIWILARHNYRQTCVELDDGILQPKWHNNNQRLHLCGVSTTGYGLYEPTDYELSRLRRMATAAAYSMAIELGLPLPSNVTTVKPSGTVSKVMGTSEGIHTPAGEFIFNWVVFARTDPLVTMLNDSNYDIIAHPVDVNSVLVCLPERFVSDKFTISSAGHSYDAEDVGVQFRRYLRVQKLYSDQNVSNTLYYEDHELDELFELMLENWDDFIAVSFMPRQDISMSSEEIKESLGVTYLPQEIVTEEVYMAYTSKLKEINVFEVNNDGEYESNDGGCSNGACPIR